MEQTEPDVRQVMPNVSDEDMRARLVPHPQSQNLANLNI